MHKILSNKINNYFLINLYNICQSKKWQIISSEKYMGLSNPANHIYKYIEQRSYKSKPDSIIQNRIQYIIYRE